MISKPKFTRDQLFAAAEFVAEIASHRPDVMPIFDRLEQEIAMADPLARLRAMRASAT